MRDNYIGTNTFGFYYNGVKYVQEDDQGIFGLIACRYSAVFESDDDIVLTARILPRYSDQNSQRPISIQLVGFRIPRNLVKEQGREIQLSGSEVVVPYYYMDSSGRFSPLQSRRRGRCRTCGPSFPGK